LASIPVEKVVQGTFTIGDFDLVHGEVVHDYLENEP
jgi:acetoacetate decarboxylase